MASVKLVSKADAFKRHGQAWFCATGLPSDVIVKVGEISFHLHKFPLLSRCGLLERKIREASEEEGDGDCFIEVSDVPGGAKAFELVAKFCYGVKLELTAATAVCVRCAAEHLLMTEDYGEGNLIEHTETFIDQVVLRSWKDSVTALQACDDVEPHAEDVGIVERCIESLASKACTDPNLFSWPVEQGPMQSPGGSVLWNGISTGARVGNNNNNNNNCYASDWWYEDVASLSLPVYKRLLSSMESSHGARQETIVGSLACYSNMHLPGLMRRSRQTGNSNSVTLASAALHSDEEQKVVLEEIVGLLPMRKGLASTRFLFGLLRTAAFLRADPSCVSDLEKVIGMQLDQAALEDLLMPNFSYSMEPLYNIDCVQRMVEHFLAMDKEETGGGASPCYCWGGNEQQSLLHSSPSPSVLPIYSVAKLIDGFLAEVAPDVNLKLPKFLSLATAVPGHARPLEDGIYRAIDIYLKAHPWLTDSEREQVCRLMDCQKLSLEACTHAAQNERLPLRVVVQVLFFEQLQLRGCIASCYLVSGNLDATGSRPFRSGCFGGPAGTEAGSECGGAPATATATARQNHVMKLGMDSMRMRVLELEKECSAMRREIQKLGQGKSSRKKPLIFGFKMKPQMCSTGDGAVSGDNKKNADGARKVKKLQPKLPNHNNVLP